MSALQWVLERLLSWLRARGAQEAADDAAITRNQEAARAARVAQDAVPAARPAFADAVRRGADF